MPRYLSVPLSLVTLAVAVPVAAQTRLPVGVGPLFDQPLSVNAYISRGEAADQTARVELKANGNALQTSVIRTQAMGVEVQTTLTYWNSLFLIKREIKTFRKTHSMIADTLTILGDEWKPLRVGSRIAAELDWGLEGTETISCEIVSRSDARQLNTSLDGAAWKVDCLSEKAAEGPEGKTRTEHYFVEKGGFDFITKVNNAAYQLVGIEPRQ